MWKPSRTILIAFAVTTVAGAALHFVYELFPNVITAVLSPVNESIWEHIKILFWPYLSAALVLQRREGKEHWTLWLLSLLIISALMLAASYTYYIAMGKATMSFGPIIYVVLMAIGFVLPSMLRRAGDIRWANVTYPAVIVLGIAIVLFTFLPPDHVLFIDLSGANTWAVIPW